jgi:hypothetical protein
MQDRPGSVAYNPDPSWWINVGVGMKGPTAVKVVDGIGYTQKQCFLEAINLDPTQCAAWCNLGTAMEKHETISTRIGGSYSKQQCFREALRTDTRERPALTSAAWERLGVSMMSKVVMVNGVQYCERDCYLEALKHDPNNSGAWHNLGVDLTSTESISVNGARYSKRDCCVEALKLDPKNSSAWNNLGVDLTSTEPISVNGAQYSKRDCYVEALKHDPKSSTAWACLAVDLTSTESVSVNGEYYTKRDCHVEALKHNPKESCLWTNLGIEMQSSDSISVNDVQYSKRNCFVEALRHDPKCSSAWNQLGFMLTERQHVTELTRDRVYSKLDCYIKAIENDPHYGDAWINLALYLGTSEVVLVNRESFSRRKCFVRGLKEDPHVSAAWSPEMDYGQAFQSLSLNTRFCNQESISRILAQPRQGKDVSHGVDFRATLLLKRLYLFKELFQYQGDELEARDLGRYHLQVQLAQYHGLLESCTREELHQIALLGETLSVGFRQLKVLDAQFPCEEVALDIAPSPDLWPYQQARAYVDAVKAAIISAVQAEMNVKEALCLKDYDTVSSIVRAGFPELGRSIEELDRLTGRVPLRRDIGLVDFREIGPLQTSMGEIRPLQASMAFHKGKLEPDVASAKGLKQQTYLLSSFRVDDEDKNNDDRTKFYRELDVRRIMKTDQQGYCYLAAAEFSFEVRN